MLVLLQRLEQPLALLGQAMVVVSMAIALVFTAGQALDRYGLNTTFDAYDQIAQLGLVWLTFIGNMLAIRENVNIRVDLIDGMLSARWLRVRNIIADIVILALLLVIQIKIWRLVELGSQQSIIGTPFTSATTYLALAFGSLLGLVIVSVRLVLELSGRSGSRC